MELLHTTITAAAVDRVAATLRSGWVSEGDRVREFEDALARRFGISLPVATNSGTSALHLALAVARIPPGSEVILPAQTFIATGLAVIARGAIPVFCDVDRLTGCLDADALEHVITSNTRAVIPVHWGGYPADMRAITRVVDDAPWEQKIAIIEDAAQAFGATYHEDPVGALSRFTCFSFQATKHLTTGDGGALACRYLADAEYARTLRFFGIDRREKAGFLGEREGDVTSLGDKWHMNDVAASMGLGNLDCLDARLEKRRSIAFTLQHALFKRDDLGVTPISPSISPAWWFFSCLVSRRDDFLRAMRSRGVPCSVVNQSIARFALFQPYQDFQRGDRPGQAWYDEHHAALPCHDGLTDEDVGTIIGAVEAGW